MFIAASGGLGRLPGRAPPTGPTAAGSPAIPTPLEPLAAVPAGVELDLDGVSPFFTPNDRFYRVDTALQIPAIAADEWSLRIHGMVDRELTLSLEELPPVPDDRARHHAHLRVQPGRR